MQGKRPLIGYEWCGSICKCYTFLPRRVLCLLTSASAAWKWTLQYGWAELIRNMHKVKLVSFLAILTFMLHLKISAVELKTEDYFRCNCTCMRGPIAILPKEVEEDKTPLSPLLSQLGLQYHWFESDDDSACRRALRALQLHWKWTLFGMWISYLS